MPRWAEGERWSGHGWQRPPGGEVRTSRPPTCDYEPEEVEKLFIEYPDLPAGAFVVSGPLRLGGGPGRRFDTAIHAERWVKQFYGGHLGRVHETAPAGRWAFRVRARSRRDPSPHP